MICLSFLIILAIGSQHFALAEPSPDPLTEFCSLANDYLLNEAKTRTEKTKHELQTSWQLNKDKVLKTLGDPNKSYGAWVREKLPAVGQQAEKRVSGWFTGARGSVKDVVQTINTAIRENPVSVSDISRLGSKVISIGTGWLKSGESKLNQLKKEGCAITLIHEAELKKIYSQVEGLTVAIEDIPSSRNDCLGAIANFRLAVKCRQLFLFKMDIKNQVS